MVRFWMIFEGGTARSCNRKAMGVKESESPAVSTWVPGRR